MSPPELIGGVIARAVQAQRPRTRYAAGYMARPAILMRKWLGDRLFDWMITSMA